VSLRVTRVVLALAGIAAAGLVLSTSVVSASASPRKDPEIIAHLPDQGVNGTQLTVRSKGSRTYLDIYEPGNDASTTIDVTKANKPVLLRRKANAGGVETQRVGAIAVVQKVDRTEDSGGASATTKFMDVSDSEHPRPIPQLDGATGMAVDKLRGYMYVANDKGLWVIRDESLVDPGVRAWYDFANAP